jgi:hypothetical protein
VTPPCACHHTGQAARAGSGTSSSSASGRGRRDLVVRLSFSRRADGSRSTRGDPRSPSSFPSEGFSLAHPGGSSGSGIVLARPLPARDGQWLRPGSYSLTAAGQRGIHTPFPDPTASPRGVAQIHTRSQAKTARG